ncbi:MAG: gfo/Idh/MocA family oxidoreductase [Candidatus Aenigmatarchaeota archaeon]|nr:MAG: gfo/Idh/MocA family oxidoreductase [Candidatus Aenigmarchaeota archaeon]
MNVGVIGAGNMGRNHIRVYSELKGVEEIYIFDANLEQTKKMSKFGVNICSSLEELLDKVDCVSICAPTKYHFEIAKKCIEKNIPCLIEKPITLNYEEGKKLLKLDKEKIIKGVGHIERFNPVISEIAKIIEKPLYIELKRRNPGSSRITDVSIIEDLMIHDIDIIFNKLFKNKPYKIEDVMGNSDLCNISISFGDCFVSLSGSRISNKKIRKIYIEEKDKTIEGDFMTQEIFIYKKPSKYLADNSSYKQENIIEKVLTSKIEPLRVELKLFLDCIKKGEEFPISALEGVSNLKICERIRGLLK